MIFVLQSFDVPKSTTETTLRAVDSIILTTGNLSEGFVL